ncbi:hypothetical protein [Actinomadura napierensis]|uniref:Uncharacterized protein n=1 Tax=Actinomadura napierensis TaxID=267854 RepID=A0ABN3ACL0_9ACTN
MTGMIGRRYLDPGDRLSGRNDPPEVVTVLARWAPGGGPRNVLVRRLDGSRQVIPFPRRLRRLDSPGFRAADRRTPDRMPDPTSMTGGA